MNEKKYFIDDIKKMTKEELQKELDKFENEAKKEKRNGINNFTA